MTAIEADPLAAWALRLLHGRTPEAAADLYISVDRFRELQAVVVNELLNLAGRSRDARNQGVDLDFIREFLRTTQRTPAEFNALEEHVEALIASCRATDDSPEVVDMIQSWLDDLRRARAEVEESIR